MTLHTGNLTNENIRVFHNENCFFHRWLAAQGILLCSYTPNAIFSTIVRWHPYFSEEAAFLSFFTVILLSLQAWDLTWHRAWTQRQHLTMLWCQVCTDIPEIHFFFCLVLHRGLCVMLRVHALTLLTTKQKECTYIKWSGWWNKVETFFIVSFFFHHYPPKFTQD